MVKKRHALAYFFQFMILTVCFFGSLYYVRARINYTLNSDDSSELTLGKLLSDEGTFISKNWYYSTELRVVNTNLIYPLAFKLTDSWHRARMITTGIFYILLLFGFYSLSRAFQFKKHFALFASFLYIPFSYIYFEYILKGLHYLPYVLISFAMLCMAEFYATKTGERANLILIFSVIFSLLVGLGGARQLFNLYIPLLFASLIQFFIREKTSESVKWFLFSVSVFLGNIAGFVINIKVLANIYTYWTWEEVSFIGFDVNRFFGALNGILKTYGYSVGNIFSVAVISNISCALFILITIYAIVYALKNKTLVSSGYYRLSLFYISAFVVFMAFYSFTDAIFNDRYCLPFIVLSIPLAAMCYEQSNLDKFISLSLFTVFLVVVAANGFVYYKENWVKDSNEDLRKITKLLLAEDFHNGYAAFWWTNVITELSEGQIEMWSVVNDFNDLGFYRVHDIDQIYHSLQAVRHDTVHPSGKVFILFTDGEFENNNWKDYLKEEDILYRSDEYVVMGYDSYEKMIDTLYPGYVFDFGDNLWLQNGYDTDQKRILFADGESRGPDISLWPGSYTVLISGQNLDNAEVSYIHGKEASVIEPVISEQNGFTISNSFDIKEKVRHFETIIHNKSTNPESIIEIESIQIRKNVQ